MDRAQSQIQVKNSPPSFAPVRGSVLQRTCDHRFSFNSRRSEVPPIVQEVLHSPGQPLDASTRALMEPRFGHDFSRVRVHTDAQAAESARAVDAQAYTVGRSVVFGAGQYAPKSNAGQQLIAHELTHVLQQSKGAVSDRANSGGMGVSDPNDS